MANKKEDLTEFPILSRLIKVFDTYKNCTKSDELNDYLIDFKTYFGSKCDERYQTKFKEKYTQQDAAEFLSFALQFIEEEINNIKPVYKFNKPSPVDQNFQYSLVNQEKCNHCGKVTKLESECTNTFHLELTTDRSLQSAFIKRIGNEESPNKCSRCKGTQTIEKFFEKLPKVLIFQPVRYNESFEKDLEKIHANSIIYLPRFYIQEPKKVISSSFPSIGNPSPKRTRRQIAIANKKLKSSGQQTSDELKENTPNNHGPSPAKSLCLNLVSGNQKANSGDASTSSHCERFKLASIICHYGPKTTSGHYKSYVYKHPKWFLCNDDFVHEVDPLKLSVDVSTKGLCYYYSHIAENGE